VGDKHLKESLSQYHSIHKDDLKHKVLKGRLLSERLVELPLSGKTIHLHLVPCLSAFSEELEVYTVDEAGGQQHLPLEKGHFYTGSVLGHSNSSLVAHLPEDGILTASISLNTSHTYYIERSELHIHESHDYHMIAYLESDVRWNFTGFQMDSVHPNPQEGVMGEDPHRLKRQAPGNTADRVCPMALVADHRFTANYAMGSASLAASLMVIQLLDASASYQKTVFRGTGASYNNFGLQVRRIIVHTKAMQCTPSDLHYNCDKSISSDNLLTYFALSDWTDVCLAHLFTYTQFTDGRLGLAYIAEIGNAGGICETPRRRESTTGRLINYNTGFSSYISPQGRRLLQREGLHATTHEIGHGWGGQHDPADRGSDCNQGGPYIMYPFALDGSQEAHKTFSRCSELLIGRVLESKGGCFEVSSSTFCGNGVVDAGEDCDPGSDRNDKCCSASCRYINGAQCSDDNHVCCTNCQVAGTSVLCRPGSTITCHNDAFCDGAHVTCPEGSPSSNVGDKCFGGTCQDVSGAVECVGHCRQANRTACLCTGDDACLVCCVDESDGQCKVFNSSASVPIVQSEGFRCLRLGGEGVCENGTCQQLRDFQRSVGGTEASTQFDLGEFISTNIVGTVAFFVFLLFLVPSCAIHWLYDRKYYDRYVKKYLINKKKSTLGKLRKTHREKKPGTVRQPAYVQRTRNDVSLTFEGSNMDRPLIRDSS
jgi:hypothetical protein